MHIIATPRQEESRTLKVSRQFLDNFRKKYPNCFIDELNVSTETLASLTVKVVSGKYVLLSGKELIDKLKDAWDPVERHIERFLLANAYLISTPMWNFSIPHTLKHYIDIIIQPQYLFRYTTEAVEGLVKNRKMVVITSRGGDYSPESPFHAYDFQEPYLRAIFGFVGITDITFINVQAADASSPEVLEKKIEEAKKIASRVVEGF
jgi:FMN-dependent NADH-azoreductase